MSKQQQVKTPADPIPFRVVNGILSLPRLVRIIIAAIFGAATTLALFEVVDQIYLDYFFSESTRVAPALVSGGFGMLMYVIGWSLIVGTIGEDREAKLVTVWYVVIGIFALLLVGMWFFRLFLIDSSV